MRQKYKRVNFKEIESVSLVTQNDPDFKKIVLSISDKQEQEKLERYTEWCEAYPEIVDRIREEHKNFLKIPEKQRGNIWWTKTKEKYIRHKLEYESKVLDRVPPPSKEYKNQHPYRGDEVYHHWAWQTRNALFNYILNTRNRSERYMTIEDEIRNYLEERADKVLSRIFKIFYRNNIKPFFKYPDVLIELNGFYILLECKTFAWRDGKQQLHDYSLLFRRTKFYKENEKPILSVLYSPESYYRKKHFDVLVLCALRSYKRYPYILYVDKIIDKFKRKDINDFF